MLQLILFLATSRVVAANEKACIVDALASGRLAAFEACTEYDAVTELALCRAELAAMSAQSSGRAALVKRGDEEGSNMVFSTITPQTAYDDLVEATKKGFALHAGHKIVYKYTVKSVDGDFEVDISDDAGLASAFAIAREWGFNLVLTTTLITVNPTTMPTTAPTSSPSYSPTASPTSKPTHESAVDCAEVMQRGITESGIYKLEDGLGNVVDAYCDFDTPNGPWVLVASVHEDNIAAKCDGKDRWTSTAGGDKTDKPAGTEAWWNKATFGAPDQATKDDYKSPLYWTTDSSAFMLAFAPMNSEPADWQDDIWSKQVTGDIFEEYSPSNLYGLYNVYKPIYGQQNGGFAAVTTPVTYAKGDANLMKAQSPPNCQANANVIELAVWNNEKGVNALCPAQCHSHDTEHICMGGGGHFPGHSGRLCSDYSGWDWNGERHGDEGPTGWSVSGKLLDSAALLFYRTPVKYTSCHEVKEKVGETSGLYTLSDGAGGYVETYCDFDTPNGPWVLVASVHEDDVTAKCNAKDRWSNTNGDKADKPAGTKAWTNSKEFGSASQATKDDFKSALYRTAEADAFMIAFVPMNSEADTWQDQIWSKQVTGDIFANNSPPNLYGFFNEKPPVADTGKKQTVGLRTAVTYAKGDANLMKAQLPPNCQADASKIELARWNYEGGANALCPAVCANHNTEHICIGGGGHWPGHSGRLCSDYSGWDWDGAKHGNAGPSGWSASGKITDSVTLLFYKERAPVTVYTSCKDVAAKVDGAKSGLYTLGSGESQMEVYCDFDSLHGPWVLVASVHEDSIATKCDDEDRWTNNSGNNQNAPAGTKAWYNKETFGAPSRASMKDYKSPLYWEMDANAFMLAFVPMNAKMADWQSQIWSKQVTGDIFGAYEPKNLFGLYTEVPPVYNARAGGFVGLQADVTYLAGNAGLMKQQSSPNCKADTGKIEFSVWNHEKGANALCPYICESHDTEHSCMGGGGYFPGHSDRLCTDFSGWDWDGERHGNEAATGWSVSGKLLDSAALLFYKE